MRTRTLVVAGTGAAAAAYLFDPRQGRARRDRIRATIQPLTRMREIKVEPPSPLPQNLAPRQSAPPGSPQNRRPIPYATPKLSHHEPASVASPAPLPQEPVSSASPNAAVDDSEIIRNVRTTLEERRDLGTNDLVVDVVNGVAYLSGALHDQHTFGEVVDLTGQVPGVRRVQSLLHLPHSETIVRAKEGRTVSDA
jgi:hypothetical protein